MSTAKYLDAAIGEVARRQGDEREKAIRKYGEIALASGGRPDFDVMDFAANELVGLIRYGQMISARSKDCVDLMEELPRDARAALKDAVALGKVISARGEALAVELIAIRLALKAAGLHLGLTEKAS